MLYFIENLFFTFYTYLCSISCVLQILESMEILSFTNFIFLWSLYLTGSMSHKLCIRTLCFTNSSSHRIHVFHKFQILLILYSTSFCWYCIILFSSTKNEMSESFIFLTNCFLLRREKSLDRFSIQPRRTREFPLGTRIFCMHRLLRKGWRGREEGKNHEERVNTFPFGAVGEGRRGRFIRRNSGRNLMQINAGRWGCGTAGKWRREMLSIVLRRYM